ncbi:MAG: hypothetical protein KJZ70_03890 [Bryobacterales bacterium]|nr:hypothetical protein [Bryobacterales bacterium]
MMQRAMQYEHARQIIDDLIDYNFSTLTAEASGKLDRIWSYLRSREVSEIIRTNGYHGQPSCSRSNDFYAGNGFD